MFKSDAKTIGCVLFSKVKNVVNTNCVVYLKFKSNARTNGCGFSQGTVQERRGLLFDSWRSTVR
jgi:hypothetical protein